MKAVDVLARWRSRTSIRSTVAAGLTAAMATLVVALVGFAALTEDVTGRNGLQRTDASRLHLFTAHRSAVLVRVSHLVTDAGAIGVLVPLALLAFAVLWWRRVPVVFAVAPLVGLLEAGTATAMLKQAIGRARPPLGLHLVSENGPSFPSGHATDSTAFYVTLGVVVAVVLMRRPIARVAVVLAGAAAAAAIGLSRLVLGVHWPTDVMAGWALGTAVALSVVVLAAAVTHVSAGDANGTSRSRRLAAHLNARRPSRLPHGALSAVL